MNTDSTSDAQRAHQLAAGLRSLADMIQAHPELVRDYFLLSDINVPVNHVTDPTAAITAHVHAATEHGATATEYTRTEWAGVRLSWGPLGLCVYASAGKVNGPILADGTVTS